jgi:hypothetical protein
MPTSTHDATLTSPQLQQPDEPVRPKELWGLWITDEGDWLKEYARYTGTPGIVCFDSQQEADYRCSEESGNLLACKPVRIV